MEDAQDEDVTTHTMGSYGSTYMWQICSKIFTYNTSDSLNGQIDLPCRNWFLDALERCSEMVFLRPEPKVHTWLFHQMMNLRFYIFPRAFPGDTSVTNQPHVCMHPELLTKADCNQLFVETAKDYIEIAPRYALCQEDNFHYAVFLKGLFGLLTAYLVMIFLRCLFRRRWWRVPKTEPPLRTGLASEDRAALCRASWFGDRSLMRHKFEVHHLKVDKTNVKKLYCDAPTLAIKVKKKELSQVLCTLIRSDPLVDEQRNGYSRRMVTKSRGYALHKLNLFLNNRNYCRIILDIGFDEDEFDVDVDTNFSKKHQNLSAGDQPCVSSQRKESTMDESADTSSVGSSKHPHDPIRRRYCSKHKQTYLHSIGWGDRAASAIPTLEKHRTRLVRKDSSNSVSILHRRDSRLLMSRSSEVERSGRSSLAGAGESFRSARTTDI